MMRHFAFLRALCACLSVFAIPAVAQGGLTVVGISNDSIATIDLVTGNAVNPHPISVPGKTVVQTYGVARDPQTGTVYAVVAYFEIGGRRLITVDPATGAATDIGQSPVLSDIAFTADGTLYGVAGNAGGVAGTLYILNKATGAGTSVAQLSAGSGHTLAFNAEDGLLYHGGVTCDSSSCYFYLESIDPQAPTPPNPPRAHRFLENSVGEVSALVHLGKSNFLVSAFGLFFLVNTAKGTASSLPADTSWSGLTTIPSGGACPPAAALYATGPFEGPSMLFSVDPGSGAATFVGLIGFDNVTGIDFASDAVLYAVGTRADDSGAQVLLTIDPCTGEGTEVGPTGTSLRELMAGAGGGLYSYSGQNFSAIDKVTGAATTIGNSGIFADDFGLEYSPTDDKIYFANIFNAIGTLYSIDPATGASAVVSQLTLPPNIAALRAMDFNPGNNTMYALIADSAFPGTTSLATVDTSAHSISSVGTRSHFTTLAFKNGTPHANYQLTVIKEGDGDGTVTSLPTGIDCGVTCQFAFDTGTKVTLTAVAANGSRFEGWSGACRGIDTCVTTVNAMRTVNAVFSRVYNLHVQYGAANQGHGGRVTINDGGFFYTCLLDAAPCDVLVRVGDVFLHADASAGGTFNQWETVCVNGDPTNVDCQLNITGPRTVGADFFGPNQLAVQVINGNGESHVVASPTGAACFGSCSLSFAIGAEVEIFEAVGSDQIFKGFGGDCTGATCTLTMSTDHSITATFADAFSVQISKPGNGAGTITPSIPGSLGCGSSACNGAYEVGTVVSFTAAADLGSTFTGWGGACSGTGACQVTSNTIGQIDITATFTLLSPQTLTVTRVGAGGGTVVSADSGINCGTLGNVCSKQYPDGTVVTLTAHAEPGSAFVGWSGDCTGTGNCLVTMTAAHNVTATFDPVPVHLVVLRAGSGSGAVTSDVPGINCGNTCSGSFPFNTVVTLSAAPTPGSSFAGWSDGNCPGTGACQVTLLTDQNVTATFSLQSFTLNVGTTGTGTGTVTGTGINCPGTCSVSNLFGTTVTLTATPSAESSFAGWSGACSGTAACQVTFDAAKNVTANFAFVGPFSFGTTPPPTTVLAGQAAVFNISILQHTASSGTITFACGSGLPAGAACSFNPASIPFTPGTNAAVNTQLTITTTPRTSAMLEPPVGVNPVWAISLCALLYVMPRRRRLQGLFAVCIALVVFLPACGGGGHSTITTTTKTQNGTPAGTYTVNVAAISGLNNLVVKTTAVTLNVQ